MTKKEALDGLRASLFELTLTCEGRHEITTKMIEARHRVEYYITKLDQMEDINGIAER